MTGRAQPNARRDEDMIGIETRHREGCPVLGLAGAQCRCTPAFRASVYDRRSKRQHRKSFDDLRLRVTGATRCGWTFAEAAWSASLGRRR